MTVPLSRVTTDALVAVGLDPVDVARVADVALAEDLAGGADVTSLATVAFGSRVVGSFVPRSSGVVAGLAVAAAVLEIAAAGDMESTPLVPDGTAVTAGTQLLLARGPTRALLTGERSALNLLCHLSGIATLTRRWVDAVAGTGALIRDTRKTTPGLRFLEKYAVRSGGGANHRHSLCDAALIKDNHVLAAGGITRAYAAVRAAFPDLAVEVECDTVAQVREAIAAGAELVLLDNMTLADIRSAVELARDAGVRTEASGGLTLDGVRAIAEAGVDYLAVGALTHSAPALDVGLDLAEAEEP